VATISAVLPDGQLLEMVYDPAGKQSAFVLWQGDQWRFEPCWEVTPAYVGSANLTGPGLSDHLELGLLVHGQVAKQIEEMWQYSIEIGLFVEVG